LWLCRDIPNRDIEVRTMKRIIVTGGAGFIGSHLCQRLLSDGNEVLCVDNYFTGPVNLGNPEEISILELARTIIDLTSSKAGFVHKPLPFDDPKQRCPDITLAIEKLGWKPVITLRDGLKRAIEYFDHFLRQK
jgi:nucleoside-diphosphate-sugar epimerase